MSEVSKVSSDLSFGDPEIVDFLTRDFDSLRENSGAEGYSKSAHWPKGSRVIVMAGDESDWKELAVANVTLPSGGFEDSIVAGVDLDTRRSLSVAIVGTGSIPAGYAKSIIAAWDEAYREACMALNNEVMSLVDIRALDQIFPRGPIETDELNRVRDNLDGLGRDARRQARYRSEKEGLDASPRKAWQTCYGPARRKGRVK